MPGNAPALASRDREASLLARSLLAAALVCPDAGDVRRLARRAYVALGGVPPEPRTDPTQPETDDGR